MMASQNLMCGHQVRSNFFSILYIYIYIYIYIYAVLRKHLKPQHIHTLEVKFFLVSAVSVVSDTEVCLDLPVTFEVEVRMIAEVSCIKSSFQLGCFSAPST